MSEYYSLVIEKLVTRYDSICAQIHDSYANKQDLIFKIHKLKKLKMY